MGFHRLRLTDRQGYQHTLPLLVQTEQDVIATKIKEKIEKIAKEIYRADGVEFSAKAKKKLKQIKELGLDNYPVCMAKTQYSFSDNKKLIGAPTGFTITVSDFKISRGAGFVVELLGSVMTMPGLPKVPSAENCDVLDDGTVVGLF